MWQRPINCKKYKDSISLMEVSKAERNSLRQERDLLLIYRNCLDSLCQLSSEGFQILAVEKKEAYYFAVVLEPVCHRNWNEDRTIYLYRLPFRGQEHCICRMWFNFSPDRAAHIIDWHSREENCGYGSILMKHFIAYLRSLGCVRISGVISPVDFDHETKLRHFYKKFGFEITDYPGKRVLCLDLKK